MCLALPGDPFNQWLRTVLDSYQELGRDCYMVPEDHSAQIDMDLEALGRSRKNATAWHPPWRLAVAANNRETHARSDGRMVGLGPRALPTAMKRARCWSTKGSAQTIHRIAQ